MVVGDEWWSAVSIPDHCSLLRINLLSRNMAKYNQNDDLKLAIENNDLTLFTEDEIEEIVAEVPGANDELAWYWIVRLNNGKYALLVGWCDYTGWDCQSGLETTGIKDAAVDVALLAPEKGKYSKRNIRQNLLDQLSGKQPKYTYQD